jgi:hypothetical protein
MKKNKNKQKDSLFFQNLKETKEIIEHNWPHIVLSVKKLFGYNDTFKVKVEKYHREYYCIYYKFKGWFTKWQRLDKAYLSDNIDLLQFDFPHLDTSAECIKLAKTLTEKKVKEWNKNN